MTVKSYLTIPTNGHLWAIVTANITNLQIRYLKDDIKFKIKIPIKKSDLTIRFHLKDYILKNGVTEERYSNFLLEQLKKDNCVTLKNNFSKKLLFSRAETFLYIILYDYFLENIDKLDNNYLVISLKDIHCMYRNNTLKRFNKIDQKTVDSYLEALKNLSTKNIKFYVNEQLGFEKSYINQPLISYEKINNSSNYTTAIKYSLGSFGNYLNFTKRNCGLLPPTILHKGFNQVSSLNIALYLCRIVFMKRKSSQAKKTDLVLVLERC